MFVRRTKGINKLIPQLYLHGLALGDFDLALRGLLGEEAPVSASTVARLKESWQAEWQQWKRRRLEDLEMVYMWVDGVYVKAGLEKEKAALLVAIGGLKDGRKVILTVEPGYRESTESWSEVLRDIKDRGLNCPRLVTGDGNLGIWGALSNVYPEALEQRCWNHKWSTSWTSCRRRSRLRLRANCRTLSTPRAGRRPRRSETVSSSGVGRRLPGGWRDAGPGLGPDGDLLPVPERTLEALTDNQRGGIAVRGIAAED